MIVNDFVIDIATSNGSGSQSANNILVKSIFRMGIPVGGKNLFPSNIQGLPTWFTIRVNAQGFCGNRQKVDLKLAMNVETLLEDSHSIGDNGWFIYNDDLKFDRSQLKSSSKHIAVPFKKLVDSCSPSPKLKKLLVNMAYVGYLASLLKIDLQIVLGALEDVFKGKESVIEPNRNALLAGFRFAEDNAIPQFDLQLRPLDQNTGKILIDGNTAAALGSLEGGCTVVAWYPITPSSSLVETMAQYAGHSRLDSEGKHKIAIVQAEDELSSIAMVLGAGWAGARAMTATSGPGLSLMAEAAGLSYYAEIPAVIWDVQRVGPSTGLPTRTMQGDLLSAVYLSHGDTKQIVLLPGSPEDCFEFGQSAFDIAEELQTLVIVLSDLDLGMNFHIAQSFETNKVSYKRGKILSESHLNEMTTFGRYKDSDQDGITYRTLPGTEHPLAGYFTRGTGHDEYGRYSEKPIVYKKNVDRLLRKWESAKQVLPLPRIQHSTSSYGVLFYGSTAQVIPELLSQMTLNTCQIMAVPFHSSVADFIQSQRKVFVIDQNRDGQMYSLLLNELKISPDKLISIRVYDGQSIESLYLFQQIEVHLSELR